MSDAVEALPADGRPAAPKSRFAQVFARPPWVGLLAFVVVFLVQGLGHTMMIGMQAIFGAERYLLAAFVQGLAGVVLLFVGMRSDGEVAGTWYGFWGGSLIWDGWVEFAFVWNAKWLGVPNLMDPFFPGLVATKAEYLVMMSSVGVCGALLVPLMLNRETKCNMFHWLQRRAKLSTGRPSRGYERNFAYITCLETIFVTWVCYLALLFIYDENILGDRHPLTYVIVVLNTAWAAYLFSRLVQMWKVTTAVRYAIPTAIIAYSSYEIVHRWRWFADIWVHPERFGGTLAALAVVMALIAAVAARTPAHQKAKLLRPTGD